MGLFCRIGLFCRMGFLEAALVGLRFDCDVTLRLGVGLYALLGALTCLVPRLRVWRVNLEFLEGVLRLLATERFDAT